MAASRGSNRANVGLELSAGGVVRTAKTPIGQGPEYELLLGVAVHGRRIGDHTVTCQAGACRVTGPWVWSISIEGPEPANAQSAIRDTAYGGLGGLVQPVPIKPVQRLRTKA